MKTSRFNNLYLFTFGIIALLLAGCPNSGGGGGNSGSLRVRVVDYTSAATLRVPNATVVLGNSNGDMVTYGTTDANGEISFVNPPVNATVTSAMSCTSVNGTSNDIHVIYDVNVSTVSIEGCSDLTPLGTMTLMVTNPTGSYERNQLFVGSDYYLNYGSLISSQTVTVYSSQLQSDGKLTALILGEDSRYNSIGYGIALDLDFVSGMTVTIPVDQPLSRITYNFTNIPDSLAELVSEVLLYRKNQFAYVFNSVPMTSVTSTTVDAAYIPGLSDGRISYYAGVDLDRNGNGYVDASLWSGLTVSGAPSNQSFDFSQLPAIPANLAVSYATGTARPTLTWSGTDGNSIVTTGQVDLTNPGNAFNVYFDASPSRTSIIFPELPAVLAQFRPSGINSFSVGNLVINIFSGYVDYLTSDTGTPSVPAAIIYKQSSAYYESSASPAPSLRKAKKPLSDRPSRF